MAKDYTTLYIIKYSYYLYMYFFTVIYILNYNVIRLLIYYIERVYPDGKIFCAINQATN